MLSINLLLAQVKVTSGSNISLILFPKCLELGRCCPIPLYSCHFSTIVDYVLGKLHLITLMQSRDNLFGSRGSFNFYGVQIYVQKVFITKCRVIKCTINTVKFPENTRVDGNIMDNFEYLSYIKTDVTTR